MKRWSVLIISKKSDIKKEEIKKLSMISLLPQLSRKNGSIFLHKYAHLVEYIFLSCEWD